jgi:hypothetical protein
MIVETNPEPEDGKVLGENFEDHVGFDQGLIPGIEHLPRGSELRAELSPILSLADEFESVSFLSDPNNTYAANRRFDLQARLSTELEKLQRYKSKLDREVLRCKKNSNRIRTDSERLNLDETRQCYLEAEDEQQKQLDEAVRDRDAVSWAMSKVRSALPHLPLPGYQNNPGRLGNEVDDLLSFGPLGQKKGN